MIVVDASALIEVLLRTPAALSIETILFAPGETLHAPHLIDLEVAQVIRRYVAKGAIDDERGRAALGEVRVQPYPFSCDDWFSLQVCRRLTLRPRRVVPRVRSEPPAPGRPYRP